ncbi:MAG: FtsX-like permease family protein [Caldilineaceae bacterium]|nr:FtsX-like permease family protein [Caldilineaceae bacterium]
MLDNLSMGVIAFLVGAVTAILLYLLFLWWRNPVLMKIGLRSLTRRPGQSVLITIGLTLSTIIIISSLGVGDTLRYSVQKQAVSAYGKVDEIIAPPLLSLLAGMANPNVDPAQAEQAQATMDSLMEGGLDSVLALVQGGLPSIGADRLAHLRAAAAEEPLIDGVAGSIVFPTIIRNVSTGQSEPLGFIFAVDDTYATDFGLTSVDGKPLTMDTLQPGVGNIFVQASNLFAVVPALTEQFGQLQTALPVTGSVSSLDAVQALAGLGALFTTVNPAALPDIAISLNTLDGLGVNTAPLRALGKERLTLQEIAALVQAVDPSTAMTGTVSIPLTGVITGTQTAASADATLQIDPTQLNVESAVGSLGSLSTDLLRVINLNTLGYELDNTLGRFGLQLRQGDLYLNRLGAERLGASTGDLVEIYIGPLPVRFRVRAVVDQAGPLSALTPVVMLRLDEAQQLLFMPDKVNSVLISNLGDEMSGMEHTDAVSKRLRVLALDDASVATLASILARPDVQTTLQALSADLPDTGEVSFDDEEDVPPMLAGIIENVLSAFNIEQMSRQDAEGLLAASAAGVDTPALRELLARPTVREWLLMLEVPDAVSREFATAVANLNQFEQIEPLNKTTIVSAANVGGGIFSTIFSIFGVFSILAAILLIVLIFVMLAAERRIEIGISRAIGVQRSQIVQSFMAEGMVYNLLAAALGVLLGIGITFAMTQFIGRLFNDLTGTINAQAGGIFGVSFNISWESVVVAYCAGVLITWLAMTLSSWRVTRMNIATAIRGLSDEAEAKRRSWVANAMSWLWPLVVLGAGGYLLVQALATNSLSLIMIAATVLLYGLTVLVGRVLELTPIRNETGYRIVYTLLGLGLLGIWTPPWYTLAPQWFPDRFTWDPTQAPTVFTIGGPMIIVGAILVVMFNANLLSAILSAILGFVPSLRPVLRTAIAYPLSSRFRTGMTMVLFAMIMATVVVMAVVISTTQSLTRLDDRQTAGFEIEVSSTLLSFFNPVGNFPAALAELTDDPVTAQVAAVGLVTEQPLEGRLDGGTDDFARTSLAGVNAGYVAAAQTVYHLRSRAPGFADDAAVWEALLTRDDVVIARPALFRAAPSPLFGPPPEEEAEGGPIIVGGDATDMQERRSRRDEFRGPRLYIEESSQGNALPEIYLTLAADGADGVRRTQRVQVIGVLEEEDNLVDATLIGSEATLAGLRSVPVTGEKIYVKVNEGLDVRAVAGEIERAFVSSGLDVVVLADSYAQRQRLTGGALQLLQGFMALGLLVGIAALGVISTRSVYERRQQIGMLRAIGYQRSMVGVSFLIESSFVSITGLLIGAITGVVLGDNLVLAFFPQIGQAAISTPWLQIGLVVLAAYLFSLLTTIAPAWQASRVYPADALRYE